MAVLQLNNIHKSYGHVTILDDVTVTFTTEQKIGFIGRNGAGKSTLCKIITGDEEADAGTITKSSDLRLSYLEQHDPYRPEETVLNFLARYTEKPEWQCGEMAARFMLKNEVLEAPIQSLAGGYRTRVKLAAMLLREPNFLILDEPTNYLDLSTLILLENFLNDFDGGFVIVSHDREFLKRTCDHTFEVERGRAALYPGGIEDYFQFKEEQLNQKLAHNKEIERRKGELQEFIDRFRAKASTASRAKSKMKQLARLSKIEIDHPLTTVTIKLPYVELKGGLALACDNLAVGYPEKQVADRINMEIQRGAHVAVLGDNGQGKTTFLRTLAGDLPPKGGAFRWGSNLKIGYYAQHVFGTLHPQDDVYTHLGRDAAPDVKPQDILNMAGAFLFRGDDVKKKISVLSGGERARLCLAGLLLSKCQVLLLDEPTNHLDFETVEALGRALKGFSGTLFFISHDRTFVNLVATEIIDVKNGRISKYPGRYEEYVYHLECVARHLEESPSEAASARDIPDRPREADKPRPTSAEKEKSEENERRRQAREEASKLQKEITRLENRIKALNKEKETLVKETADNPFNFSKQRNQRIKEITIQVEKEEGQWLALQGKLDELKKSQA